MSDPDPTLYFDADKDPDVTLKLRQLTNFDCTKNQAANLLILKHFKLLMKYVCNYQRIEPFLRKIFKLKNRFFVKKRPDPVWGPDSVRGPDPVCGPDPVWGPDPDQQAVHTVQCVHCREPIFDIWYNLPALDIFCNYLCKTCIYFSVSACLYK
jgi:hypothetical protein